MRGAGLVRLVALLAVTGLAACSFGGDPKPHRWSPNPTGRDEDWHSPGGALMKYSTTHDGTLLRTDLVKGLKAEFDGYDTGHTGCIPSDQVTAINEQRIKADQAAATPLIDWKNQGCLDFDEYSATQLSLFDELDTNGDGKLTPEELHPKKKRAHQPPPAAIDEGQGRGGGGGY